MTFGGGNTARTKYFSGVAKPVTPENSGHSNNQLIGNLLNIPILRKMDSSDYFPSMHTPTNCHISSRPYFSSPKTAEENAFCENDVSMFFRWWFKC
jgi:hypothetical protein